MNQKIKLFALGFALCAASACESDDNKTVTPQGGDVFICTTIPSPDGMTGSAYMQLIGNVDEAAYDNRNAIPTSYSIPPIVEGKYVFDLTGASSESNTIKKYAFENELLVEKGSMVTPENSMPMDIAIRGSKGYIALRGTGQILVIDHEKMTSLKSIDLTSYGIGDQNPDPTSLIIRDNLLFVALLQIEGGYIPNPARPAVDVLIIDLDKEEPLKMITETSSGMTWPATATDQNSMFMDDQKNIYVSCYGTLGMFNSGLLRIKNGETEFDPDYQFVMNNTPISGEANKLNYLSSIVYYGGNKVYGVANLPAYFSDPTAPDYFNDRFNQPVEIDLEAKTIKALPLPRSNGYSVVVGIYDNQVVFGLATDTDTGFYTYTPASGTASGQAVITVTGYPYKFYQFK